MARGDQPGRVCPHFEDESSHLPVALCLPVLLGLVAGMFFALRVLVDLGQVGEWIFLGPSGSPGDFT